MELLLLSKMSLAASAFHAIGLKYYLNCSLAFFSINCCGELLCGLVWFWMSTSLVDFANPFSCSKITVLGLITLGKRDCCNLRMFLLISFASGARKMMRLSGLLDSTESFCSCSWSFAYLSNCNAFSFALICISISFIPISEFTSVLYAKLASKIIERLTEISQEKY